MESPTHRAVRRQIEAMGVSVFEVGVLMPAVETDGHQRDAQMLLRTWDVETLERSIGWLRARNAAGAAIYIRPHGEHPLSLIDDLKPETLPEMKKAGYQPALVVETSPGNYQAWMNHGEVLAKPVSTAAARLLAERWGGDMGAADWRHFGRLAGFVNRKPAYRKEDGQFPFVRIIESAPERVSDCHVELVAAANAAVKEPLKPTPLPSAHRRTKGLKTIDDFRADPRYNGDGNRIDLAYAIYALTHGVEEARIRAGILTRDLSKKGAERRQAQYVLRTLQKARKATKVSMRPRE